MSEKNVMTYEATSDYRYGQVACSCGMHIRVDILVYRVECPCGKSAILSELIREAKKDGENEPKDESSNGGPEVEEDISNG